MFNFEENHNSDEKNNNKSILNNSTTKLNFRNLLNIRCLQVLIAVLLVQVNAFKTALVLVLQCITGLFNIRTNRYRYEFILNRHITLRLISQLRYWRLSRIIGYTVEVHGGKNRIIM